MNEEVSERILRIRELFERHAERYNGWYERSENIGVFKEEVNTLKLFRKGGLALEIGVGTGRFAVELGIKVGVDVSLNMLRMAMRRGIEVLLADACHVPFKDEVFDEAYMIFTICFLHDPLCTLKEVKRVLKSGGRLVIAFISRTSPLGRKYMEKGRRGHVFYQNAKFFNPAEIEGMLRREGFIIGRIYSSLGSRPGLLTPGCPEDHSFCCIEGLKDY